MAAKRFGDNLREYQAPTRLENATIRVMVIELEQAFDGTLRRWRLPQSSRGF
jgi:hypothetical protein